MISYRYLSQFVLEIRDESKNIDDWLVARKVFETQEECIQEAINTEDSVVLIIKKNTLISEKWLEQCIDNLERNLIQAKSDRDTVIQIEVRYNESHPDFRHVCQFLGLSSSQLIELHTKSTYTVAMFGFTPGFAYLIGLQPELVIPRKETPNLKVSAGSLAIAGPYTGIYPFSSPGGWYVLGQSDFRFISNSATTLDILAQPGDKVQFVAV